MEFMCFITRSSILPRHCASGCRIPFITRFGSSCLLIGFESATAFAIAALSYNFYEKRFLALKNRFAPAYREIPAVGVAVAQAG